MYLGLAFTSQAVQRIDYSTVLPSKQQTLRIDIEHSEYTLKSIRLAYTGGSGIPCSINYELNSQVTLTGVTNSLGATSTSLERAVNHYLQSLPDQQRSVLEVQAQKYLERSATRLPLTHCFIYGLATYLTLLALLEERIVPAPFSIPLPLSVNSGMVTYGSYQRYVTVPFNTLARIEGGLLGKMAVVALHFINVWDGFFRPGTPLKHEAAYYLQLLTETTTYLLNRMNETSRKREEELVEKITQRVYAKLKSE